MTEFNDPLSMVRSVYSHVRDHKHHMSLCEDPLRRFVGFSCMDCTDEHVTWMCGESRIKDFSLKGNLRADRELVRLLSSYDGFLAVVDSLNQFADRDGALSWTGFGPKKIPSGGNPVIEAISRGLRNSIPTRYERKPVI